jgi:hypothetical protein
MSNPTVLQSNLVPFAVSTDGVTYKNLVCKKVWNVNLDKTIVEDESDCGVHLGTGAAKWSFDFEIILNTTPNGSTELSATTLAGYADAGTLLYVKLQYSSTYYRQGQGYISNYKESAPQGGFITATGTFRIDGSIDLTP